jgi:hypothetical protein
VITLSEEKESEYKKRILREIVGLGVKFQLSSTSFLVLGYSITAYKVPNKIVAAMAITREVRTSHLTPSNANHIQTTAIPAPNIHPQGL